MKINVHLSTYIFLLISFLSGYFEYVFILLLIITIHESGHYIFSCIVGNKSQIITIYPFGGITRVYSDLNIPLYKEFIILIGGIIFQLLFYFFMNIMFNNGYITIHIFNLIKNINYFLITFNFLPILPLDGGKLLNILLDYFFCYKLSNILSIIISIIFIIILTIINNTFLAFILMIFLCKCIVIEIYSLPIKYNKFLFERYKNKYIFNKIKKIDSYTKFKRDYYHIINNENENVFLSKMFDRTHRIC